MVPLQIEVDTNRSEKGIRELNSRIRDLSYPFKEIGEYMLTETAMRFDRGVDPDGRPWIKSKRASRDGGKTLVDKGMLRQAINYKASKDEVEIGVGNFPVYARIHQYGGRTGKGHRLNLPARPYLGINQDDIDEAQRIIEKFLRLRG